MIPESMGKLDQVGDTWNKNRGIRTFTQISTPNLRTYTDHLGRDRGRSITEVETAIDNRTKIRIPKANWSSIRKWWMRTRRINMQETTNFPQELIHLSLPRGSIPNSQSSKETIWTETPKKASYPQETAYNRLALTPKKRNMKIIMDLDLIIIAMFKIGTSNRLQFEADQNRRRDKVYSRVL